MLRTMTMLRRLSWSVFAGLAIHMSGTAAFAQAEIQLPPKDKDVPPALQPVPNGAAGATDMKTLVIQINVTKTIGMTRAPGATEDPIIEKVQNENPRVCRVQSIFNDPRHVLITGVSPGTSKITFTGYTDPNMKDRHEETIEVRVPSDDEPVREQMRRDFLELIKKTVPSANVDVVVGQNNTVFLTGNVLTADSVQAILSTATAIFGQNANIINSMRVGGVQQVEVDCVICSVNRSKLRNMSFSWSLNRPDFFLTSLLGGNAFTNSIATAAGGAASSVQNTGAGNIVFGSITDTGSFFGFLEALRTDNLAKIQAEPKIVTLSGRPAQFTSGGEVPIVSAALVGTTVEYKEFGTLVTVLPIVLGNGKIHLEVAPQISAPDPSLSVATVNITAAGFRKQGAQVAVQVEDGQTIAIGGLIQHTTSGSITKVPVLGDIPIVGAAFRSVTYEDKEEELIILVTPRLVDPMGCNQLPERLPTRLTRSPDDFELYLEGLLELPRGQRQTCGPNGCYQAPHTQGSTASQFPCGDQGSCGINGMGLRGHRGVCKTGCSPTSPCGSGACSTSAVLSAPAPRPSVTAPALQPAPAAPVAPYTPPAPPAGNAVPPTTSSNIRMPSELPATNLAPVSYNAIPADLPISAPPLRVPGPANID